MWCMDAKHDLIKESIQKLLRIAHMYARIEAMPIPVNHSESVTTHEAHTIQAIGEERSVNVTQLADHFGISKSAASQTVAKLEKRGFLVRKAAPHGGREQLLVLTELGWLAFRAHEQFHGKDFKQLVDSLSAFPISQIATLSVLMEPLAEVMEKRLSTHSKK